MMQLLLITKLAGLVLAGMLLTSCDNYPGQETNGQDTVTMEAEIAAIHTLSESVQKAYIARDWDQFADYFTDDAIWMPNEVSPLTGKDQWWTFVAPFWDTTTVIEMDIVTEEIVVAGDWAFERHSEKQVIRPASGEGDTATYYFKGIWLLQRQADGAWKIARYIWNWNPPAN